MTKSDILRSASVYGSRFVSWIDFIIDEEAEYVRGTKNLRAENLSDGQGVTFCGLTQASDGLNMQTVTPSWVAGSFYFGKVPYWKPVAGLPYPLAECVANWRVHMGVSGSTKLLQAAIDLPQDGILGPATIARAASFPEPLVLCRQLVKAADDHYRAIVARIPSRSYALADWLRRDQHLLARFVDTQQSIPEQALGVLATPAIPRVPTPRSLDQILADLVITPQVMT